MRAWIASIAIVVAVSGAASAQNERPMADIQASIDAAAEGATVVVAAGVYVGHLVVSKPITLDGRGAVTLDGGGEGDVIRIEAEGVTIRGFTIRGTGKSLDRENAGVTILKPGATIENNRIEDVLFGVYGKEAGGCVIRGNTIVGKDLALGRRGDAIRLWRCPGSLIEGNSVTRARDLVIWFSNDVLIRKNRVSEGRYGLHFMYSDRNTLEDNVLTHNSVGMFLMYSHDLTLRRNRLELNRGPTGYGIGLKDVDGVTAEGNVIAGNRLGVFLDNSPSGAGIVHNFTGNSIAYNDIGIAFMPSVKGNRFYGNALVDNLEQVAVLGTGEFSGNPFTVDGMGNYWSDYRGYDADGDGVGDLPHHCDSLFESLMDREPQLRLFLYSPAQQAIDVASRAFPVVKPRAKVTDTSPLMAAPVVAIAMPARSGGGMAVVSAGLLVVGGGILVAGRRIVARRTIDAEGAAA